MTEQKKLEKLFRQHYRQLLRLAIFFLHDDMESQDVVYEIFAQLLREPHELRDNSAETFLYTCVRNRCLNVIRGRKIQERVQRLYLLDVETTMFPTNLMEEERKALRKGIDELEPPVCKEIILRHFQDGLTFHEIARQLEVSETTVYKHLRRAINQLRTKLKYYE